jgi:hypothetical protein
VHVRTGSSDFGDSFEAELEKRLGGSNEGGNSDRWDAEPLLASPFARSIAANPTPKVAPPAGSPQQLPPLDVFQSWVAAKRGADVRTASRAAHLAAECATNLTRAADAAAASKAGAAPEPSRSVRWALASDSAAVRALLAAAAVAAGAQPWSAVPERAVAGSSGRGSGAAHHTRYGDHLAKGAGDAEAAAELFALGGGGGGLHGGDGGGGRVGALVATYGSVVARGSAFAALAASRGQVPRVFVHGPPERRAGEPLACAWASAAVGGGEGIRDSARAMYPAGLGELVRGSSGQGAEL